MPVSCTLCNSTAHHFARTGNRDYYRCANCRAVFMDPAQYITPAEELVRYMKHENDVHDKRYQQFVQPLVDTVKADFAPGNHGLDYGSGTGPVAAKLLRNDGYAITTYDPFFDKNEAALNQIYDFIISSEVIEHFHQPAKEFERLNSLLRPAGGLFCMTLRYSEAINFEDWYYKNDETHVIFYQDKTARWIQKHFKFSDLTLKKRLIILKK